MSGTLAVRGVRSNKGSKTVAIKLIRVKCQACGTLVPVQPGKLVGRIQCPSCTSPVKAVFPAVSEPPLGPQVSQANDPHRPPPLPPSAERPVAAAPQYDHLEQVRTAWSVAKAEVSTGANLAAEHMGRAKRQAELVFRREQCRSQLVTEKVRVGEAAARTGTGDPVLLMQLAQLEERLRNVRAANGAVKSLETERRGLLLRIAEPFVTSMTVPSAIAVEHQAVRATITELSELDNQISLTRLLPATTSARIWTAAAVVLPVLLLGTLLLILVPLARPRVITSSSDETAIKNAVGLVVCGLRVTAPDGQDYEIYIEGAAGTAFAVTGDGFLFTNKHVIEKIATLQNAKLLLEQSRHKGYEIIPTIWVFFDRKKQIAELIHASEQFDFAMLKVEAAPSRIFSLSGAQALPRGKQTYAIGFPAAANIGFTDVERALQSERSWRKRVEQYFLDRDFEFVQTTGSVSRPPFEDSDGSFWLQHDALIHGGNSGGPLVTEDGAVVGINTAGHREVDGISFALTLPQLRQEAERHTKKLVWK